MKKLKKQTIWRFIRLFRLDLAGFFVGVWSLWDVIVLSLIFMSVVHRFGTSFKGVGIMMIVSAVLLFNARRLWPRNTRMRVANQDLPLSVSIRLIVTVLLSVINGLILVNTVFHMF